MSKILVADLIGTLIPEESEVAGMPGINGPHGPLDIDTSIMHMSIPMKKFLSDGNILKIVTSCSGHGETNIMINKVFPSIYKYLNPYNNYVQLYLQGDNETLRELKQVVTVKENNGTIYAINKEFRVPIIFLYDKKYVFNYIKNSHKLHEHILYCIGDSQSDISMLLECKRNGGISSFIDTNFYASFGKSYNTTTEDIINRFLLAKSQVSNTFNYEDEKNKIYNQFLTQRIDLREIAKQERIYNIIYDYRQQMYWDTRLCQIQHIAPTRLWEEISAEDLLKFEMYTSFNDYLSKVLNVKNVDKEIDER